MTPAVAASSVSRDRLNTASAPRRSALPPRSRICTVRRPFSSRSMVSTRSVDNSGRGRGEQTSALPCAAGGCRTALRFRSSRRKARRLADSPRFLGGGGRDVLRVYFRESQFSGTGSAMPRLAPPQGTCSGETGGEGTVASHVGAPMPERLGWPRRPEGEVVWRRAQYVLLTMCLASPRTSTQRRISIAGGSTPDSTTTSERSVHVAIHGAFKARKDVGFAPTC